MELEEKKKLIREKLLAGGASEDFAALVVGYVLTHHTADGMLKELEKRSDVSQSPAASDSPGTE